jgi:hypothetical protein
MRRGPALLLFLLLPACGGDNTNPFQNQIRTLPPPRDAALVFTSSAWSTTPGAPRELFSANADGSNVSQLTFCNTPDQLCDTIEATSAPDRNRMIVRRIPNDSNGDGRLTEEDGIGAYFVGLDRGTEAEVQSQARGVSGVDWSRSGDLVVYSMMGTADPDDIYRSDPNGANLTDLTQTQAVRERRPRLDPGVTVAAYERIDAGSKGQIWLFQSLNSQAKVTSGAEGSGTLPGTPYVVGGDADPSFSPDAQSLVFRRLTGTGNGGFGTWDLMTVHSDGTSPAVIATGAIFRGAPDWGPQGILFAEIDAGAGTAQLVVVQPDGSGRKVLLSQSASVALTYPRWLPVVP